jgi:Cu/Zn superoxide dismutase
MLKNKKRILIISIALTALMLIAGWWFFIHNYSAELPVEEPAKVNYNPPTETEKTESNAKKEEIVNQQGQDTNNSEVTNGPKKTSVTITYWGPNGANFEVGAYANHIEQSGTCTLTLKKGSIVLTASRTAIDNVSTMSCGALSVKNSKVTPGTWTATVKYTSNKYQGSTTKQLEVQ